MCGLYGIYSSDLTTEHRSLFKRLSFLSLPRGMHSTGIAVARVKERPTWRREKKKKYFSTYWYKTTENSGLFFMRKKANEAIDHKENVVLMGHNRLATVGGLELKAAHPFEHEHILGCHNGTIKDSPYSNVTNYASDSDRLFYNIADKGLEATAKEIRTGVFAVTYIDKKQMTLNIVRNTLMRDIFLVWSEDEKTLMWASEKDFIEEAIAYSTEEWGTIFELKKGFLLSVNLVSNDKSIEKVDLEPPFHSVTPAHGLSKKERKALNRRSKYYSKSSTPSIHYPGEYEEYDDDIPFGDDKDKSEVTEFLNMKVLSYQDFPSISFYTEHGDRFVEYANRLVVPLKVYKKILNRGCAMCQGFAEEDEHVIWLSGDTFLHHHCFNDPAYKLMASAGEE